MSVNLGNSSHFDVHDASQGFSVWTEDFPGCGANWFFVVPNVHGLKSDGVTKFRGLAVKLGHGVAISWDGRVIRHCTSVSHPDGMECGRVGEVRDSHFRNHMFGRDGPSPPVTNVLFPSSAGIRPPVSVWSLANRIRGEAEERGGRLMPVTPQRRWWW